MTDAVRNLPNFMLLYLGCWATHPMYTL